MRPLIIRGPIGAGKTHAARKIHRLSGRTGVLVAVSGGEISESLYQDTLFGHVAGAFTGAQAARKGAFERAAKGTLLFDDLTYLPKTGQMALLRAVESRSFLPIGAVREVPITSREIYATTRDLGEMVETGDLLPDLESRIGGFVIRVPALVERLEDLPELADQYASEFLEEHGMPGTFALAEDALDALLSYGWPGNLRELRREVECAVVHAGMDRMEIVVRAEHLSDRVLNGSSASGKPRLSPSVVRAAVSAAAGNRSEAARRLGVHRNTLYRYLPNTA